MRYIDDNKESYEEEYIHGWGNRYPNTSIVTYYYNKILPLLPKLEGTSNKRRVLEFGCSLGANLSFFRNIGYEVYGVDISETAIRNCISMNGFPKEHFKAINILEDGQELEMQFDVLFDLIIAPDVMYYFGNKEIKYIVDQFYRVCKPSGILYSSMITYNCDAYRSYMKIESDENGLTLVKNTGSVSHSLFVNIMENDEQVYQLFSQFTKRHLLHTFIEIDGMNESIHYIGQK